MQGRGASMAEPAAPGRWRLGNEEAGGSLLASALRQVHSGTARSLGMRLGASGSHMESRIRIVQSYSSFPAPLGLKGVYAELSHRRRHLLPRHGCDQQRDNSRS